MLIGHFLVGEAITLLQSVGLGMTLVGARLGNRQPVPSG
jgi:hypothetical protein